MRFLSVNVRMLYVLGYAYNRYNVWVASTSPSAYPFGYEKEESPCSGIVKARGSERREGARRQYDPRGSPGRSEEGRGGAVEEESTDLNG